MGFIQGCCSQRNEPHFQVGRSLNIVVMRGFEGDTGHIRLVSIIFCGSSLPVLVLEKVPARLVISMEMGKRLGTMWLAGCRGECSRVFLFI